MAMTERTFRRRLGSAFGAGSYRGLKDRSREVNISRPERWISAIGGGLLAFYGLKEGGWGGIALAALGGGLIYRGATGHCDIYAALGINTAPGQAPAASVKHGEGVKYEKSIIINKPPEELYRFWRNFENLPRVMSHLESVRVLDQNLSHWVVKAPAGMKVEWDAEVYREKENEMIAWRSLEGAQIPNAGSVHFERSPDGSGTEVRVVLNYEPPAGSVGVAIAKFFGEEPEQQIEEDLRRFKQMIESGEAFSPLTQSSAQGAK
ncbi:MAG TPA: SRPBCC family protein [Blastocatellia bacterium]|nr:SRPBCC family protein [Blastocatellia bacterium]